MSRENERLANEATLLQAVGVSLLSPKEGKGYFRKLVDTLLGK